MTPTDSKKEILGIYAVKSPYHEVEYYLQYIITTYYPSNNTYDIMTVEYKGTTAYQVEQNCTEACSQADWLIGINASQALSISAGYGVWSLGRVQTPTFAMICGRYLENKDFKPQTYFQLKLHTSKEATQFAAISTERYDTKQDADTILDRVRSAEYISVLNVETKQTNQEPPLLYDLTTLQKEANSRHGFSADKTLSVAQSLYEAKLISYPRTGSRYISNDVFAEMPALINQLSGYAPFGNYAKHYQVRL